jgi:hypothetical protein
MNQDEIDDIYEIKKIIKRHTMWVGSRYVYIYMSPDNVEKISEIVSKLLNAKDKLNESEIL